MKVLVIPCTLALLFTGACSSSKLSHSAGPGSTLAVSTGSVGRVQPGDFVNGPVTNRWFPLRPGARRVYQGAKDGKTARELFLVTNETKLVQGVTCVVVRDTLYLNGKLEEQTDDWYAQDKQGNVWYFGEQTAELNPDGSIKSREGSWRAGLHRARAGIYITAEPRLGVDYLQEYYKGHAEDHFVAKRTNASTTVPAGSFHQLLETTEYTPLEPDVIDHKFYAAGVGVVKESSESGDERLELASYSS
jgi:hypothetical protein